MDHSDKRTTAASAATPNEGDNDATPRSLKKISSLYAVSFLFLALVVVGVIWHDLHTDYLDTLAYWNVQLSSSADNWDRVSDLWLNERWTDTIGVAEEPWTISLLSAGGSTSKVGEIRQELEHEITHIAEGNGFLGGAVGDRDCRIVAQTRGIRPEMAQGIREACQRAQQADEYRVDTFGMEYGHVWLSLSAPVIAGGRASSSARITRRILGSVTMVAEPWQSILRIFASESVSARTSAGLIVWRKGSEALIFSPQRGPRGVESFFRRPLTGSSFESRVALDGEVAFGQFIDFRGQPIFGVARRMGVPGYSLARKVDRDETLSEYRRRQVLDSLVGALSLLLLGSVMVAQHRQAVARNLQERVRQQEALRESDRRYRVLFESAGDGIVLMRDDHFVDCNQKALELFGCGREQLIGNTLSTFSPRQQPDGTDSREAALEKVRLAREGQTTQFEWQHLRLDGTPFEAEVTLSRLEIAGKAHLLALVRDVTERKRAEVALAESQALTNAIVESTSDFIWSVDAESFRLLTFNRSLSDYFLRWHGIPLQTGTTSRDHFPTADLVNRWQGFYERALSEGSYTTDYRATAGSGIWQLTFHLLKRDGKVFGISVFGKDITERKRAEEALRESERRYRLLFERNQAGVSLATLDGRLLDCNEVLASMFGYESRQDMLSQDVWSFYFDPADRRVLGEKLKKEGRLLGVELCCRKKDGTPVWALFSASLVPQEGEAPNLVQVTAIDISGLRRTDEELRRSFEQLRALAARLQSIREEERKRVAREIHDQLGQALTAIKIDLSSLIRDLPGTEKQRAESVLNLIDQTIQSVRKIATDLRPGILDDLGLVAAVEWAGEEFQARTGTTCRLDLPQEDIALDPERATAIFRIFQETLTNVARHADASEVGVRLAREDGDLILEVHDDGKGIPEDKLSSGESLGILGMRERAMLLGGELTISGPPGNGTTVSVRIPAARPNQPE